jgi:hypothetical protein
MARTPFTGQVLHTKYSTDGAFSVVEGQIPKQAYSEKAKNFALSRK